MLRSLLQDSGIEAYVPEELTAQFRGQIGSVRLQVDDGDAETALKILASAKL